MNNKIKQMCLVIVPETNDHLQIRANKKIAERDNSTEEEVKEDMEWRLRNIIVPSISLFPSCQIKIFNSRDEAKKFEKIFVKNIFPTDYSMYNPQLINLQYKNSSLVDLIKALNKGELSSIRPSIKAMGYVSDWIRINAKGRKVITITLRESTRLPARNSSLKDWGKFAKNLDPDIYFPVILRDTEKDLSQVPEELKNLKIFHEAVWNFELRAALYELSYLNMTVNNGPGCLLIMNDKTRYITFKVITNSVGGTSEEYFKSAGFNYGESLPRSSKYQKYVWEDDTYEVINREFKEMCKKIEKFK